mgnify:CR=1 FL=1
MRTLIQQAGDVGELLDLKALALLQRHLMQEATIAAYQDCFMVVTPSVWWSCPSYCSYDGSLPSRDASQRLVQPVACAMCHCTASGRRSCRCNASARATPVTAASRE